MTTPKPKLDLFLDSPCLVAKKCRTSTPSLRPPKPPTKSAKQVRRLQRPHIPNLVNDFSIVCKIGSGYFADVFKAKSLKDGQLYALKKTTSPFSSNSDRSRKFQEVRNFQTLPPHPNCVRYFNSWEEDGFLYIQMELCKTSLNQLLETSEERKLPEQIVWGYLLDLLAAVKHLHDHDLLHLDIKPDNIFISFDNTAKLGDFGLMCSCSELNSSNLSSVNQSSLNHPNNQHQLDGSLFQNNMDVDIEFDHDDSFDLFTIPELNPSDSGIVNKSTDSIESIDSIDEGDSKYLASETMQGKFTKAADIFSLGITIFEVASGLDLPQRGEIYHKLRHNEIEDLYLNGLSPDLAHIIKMMMEENYTKRPTIDDLLQLESVRSRKLKIS